MGGRPQGEDVPDHMCRPECGRVKDMKGMSVSGVGAGGRQTRRCHELWKGLGLHETVLSNHNGGENGAG